MRRCFPRISFSKVNSERLSPFFFRLFPERLSSLRLIAIGKLGHFFIEETHTRNVPFPSMQLFSLRGRVGSPVVPFREESPFYWPLFFSERRAFMVFFPRRVFF